MPVALPPIVYVMGPSGAGKDSLLRFARINLGPSDRIAFAHRYITRPPDVAGENHIALTREEFELRRAADLFALHWSAHDTLYGIGLEIDAWRQQGLLVIINGSRQHFATLPADPATIIPVLVTATPNILAARLAGRGREST
ncbi:MAG: phnN, partial [Rhodospirillales bacterium]|nr:phnN [Rhodospirillales bacterium]